MRRRRGGGEIFKPISAFKQYLAVEAANFLFFIQIRNLAKFILDLVSKIIILGSVSSN